MYCRKFSQAALFFKDRLLVFCFLNSFIFENVSLYLSDTFLYLRIFISVFWHWVLLWRNVKLVFPTLYRIVCGVFFWGGVLGYLKDSINIFQCELLLYHSIFSGTYAALVCKFCSLFIPDIFLYHLLSWNPSPIPFLKLPTWEICPSMKLFFYLLYLSLFFYF